MVKLFLLNCCLLAGLAAMSNTIVVKNIEELNAANKKAQPGDIIILQNGEWKDVTIKLDCSGTVQDPIAFKAQTEGKVRITGNSQLRLGGNYIVVDGLYFANGYAGKDPVINFRIDSKQLANNCRVTNTAINDFNNPKRMDENYWVAFYGKNNRLDHCSFKDKKNMGVLLAVILDDERSRENFHFIDHNYFGRRPPLASNGGEIIRVGVSQHCQFNSNTRIVNNYFEECDGETEIVSIKSCSNEISFNIFKECQGSLVLRHGDNNHVEANYFIGNDKPGTGGVRVINKGQQVISNIFYKCRGVDFRSPLAIMNGIPNSPAHRYVQVTEASIFNNTFYECAPVTFGEGSDAERTLPPDKVTFSRNTFYNTRDSIIYKVYDAIDGISFNGNQVSSGVKQNVVAGFDKVVVPKRKDQPLHKSHELRFAHVDFMAAADKEAKAFSCAKWFPKNNIGVQPKPLVVSCATAAEVYKQLKRKEPVTIQLTKEVYELDKPFIISKTVNFMSPKKKRVVFTTKAPMENIFSIRGNGNLLLKNLDIDGGHAIVNYFIANDSSGSSSHYNLVLDLCVLSNFSTENGCKAIFFAYKSMVADSIIVKNCAFIVNATNILIMDQERDDKGYYPAERVVISNNVFTDLQGKLFSIYRGGNDESTMGPSVVFDNNAVTNCTTLSNDPLLHLYGAQRTVIENNNFTNANSGKVLIKFEDIVRAAHFLRNNLMERSGKVEEDKFVQSTNNISR